MPIERLWNSPNFVDEDGNVRSNADLRPEMEVYPSGAPTAPAVRGLAKEAKRRGQEPLFGRDATNAIVEAQNAEEERLGRQLTDEELQQIAREVEWRGRGL